MLIEDFKNYYKASANYTDKTSGQDTRKNCFIDTSWWQNYPVQDFGYKFNSWGFRGPEYNIHIGKKVNLCMGDSFTVNLGGAIEHSWCNRLAVNFDIPTINLGIDGAGNDAIKLVYDRACEIFDVQQTFVMYSFLHRRLQNNDITFTAEIYDTEVNIEYFKNNMIQDAIYTFIPSWCWNEDELNYLHTAHKSNLYNLLNNDTLSYTYMSEKTYNIYKGDNWVSYNEFIKGKTNKIMQNDKVFKSKFIENFAHVNRDGFHLSREANQIIADFLWSNYVAT